MRNTRLVRPKQNVSFHLSKSSHRPTGMHTFQIENCNNTQIVVRINPQAEFSRRRVAPISDFSLVNSSKSKRAPANCRGADQFKPVDYIFQKCKRLYNAHSFPSRPSVSSLPLSLFFSLALLSFFLSGKNFSIFATLPSGCPAYRYSISSGIERPTYGLVTVRGETTRGGGGEAKLWCVWKKKGERSPRHLAERCDETVVYFYRRPYLRHRHYIGLSSYHPLGATRHRFSGATFAAREFIGSTRVASTTGPAARNA